MVMVFTNLKECLGTDDGTGYTFMSDRQKVFLLQESTTRTQQKKVQEHTTSTTKAKEERRKATPT